MQKPKQAIRDQKISQVSSIQYKIATPQVKRTGHVDETETNLHDFVQCPVLENEKL